MNKLIIDAINQYNNAVKKIEEFRNIIETVVEHTDVKDSLGKANIVNATVILHGFKLVAEGFENLLANANYVIDDNGNFYKKVDVTNFESKTKSTKKPPKSK